MYNEKNALKKRQGIKWLLVSAACFVLAALVSLLAKLPVRAEDNGEPYGNGQESHANIPLHDILRLLESMQAGISALEERLDESRSFPAHGYGSFTPDGAGDIIDNLVGPTGMEFLSVAATDGSVFYIVIDRYREEGNVYLLRAVASEDLVMLSDDAEEHLERLEELDAPPDLTNDELLHILLEVLASGIVVHVQDGQEQQPVYVPVALVPEYGEPAAFSLDARTMLVIGGAAALLLFLLPLVFSAALRDKFFGLFKGKPKARPELEDDWQPDGDADDLDDPNDPNGDGQGGTGGWTPPEESGHDPPGAYADQPEDERR